MGDVRASAQIDEGAASVNSALGSFGDSLVDEILLVLAVLEHLKELILGHLKTLKWLLGLDDVAGEGLQGLFVLVGNGLAWGLLVLDSPWTDVHIPVHVGHVIIETGGIGGRGAVAEIASVTTLGSLSENMGRGMPEDLLA